MSLLEPDQYIFTANIISKYDLIMHISVSAHMPIDKQQQNRNTKDMLYMSPLHEKCLFMLCVYVKKQNQLIYLYQIFFTTLKYQYHIHLRNLSVIVSLRRKYHITLLYLSCTWSQMVMSHWWIQYVTSTSLQMKKPLHCIKIMVARTPLFL